MLTAGVPATSASAPAAFLVGQRRARTATTSVASASGTPRKTLAAKICAGGTGPRISSGGGITLLRGPIRGGITLERAVVGGAPWRGGAKCGGKLPPETGGGA